MTTEEEIQKENKRNMLWTGIAMQIFQLGFIGLGILVILLLRINWTSDLIIKTIFAFIFITFNITSFILIIKGVRR